MIFKLPEIDREKTKRAVLSALEKYRICLLTLDERQLPRVTQTFTLTLPAKTNEFNSSTEDVAIANVDGMNMKIKYIEKIRRAVNRLSVQERQIIIKRYLVEDEVFDYEVYNEMGLSERQYYRIKSRAFYKLAFILRIEVTIERCS